MQTACQSEPFGKNAAANPVSSCRWRGDTWYGLCMSPADAQRIPIEVETIALIETRTSDVTHQEKPMASGKKNPEKKVDLPPKGDRNPDPITGEAGAHPIET